MATPSQNPDSSEDLRFEYEQLRKEILQNDTLQTQALYATIVLAGAAMTVASNLPDTILWVKGVFFFAAGVIAMIGLWQNIDFSRSTFLIASYMLTFIEPKTQYVKWETRGYAFRKRSPSLGHGWIFERYRVLTYVLLIVVGFSIGGWYIAQGFPNPPWAYLAAASTIGGLATGVFTAIPLVQHYKFVYKYDDTFGKIWRDIKTEEEKSPS